MEKFRKGINARPVWLFLLREGGWWTSTEIAHQCGLVPNEVRSTLRQMEEAGSVKRLTPDKYGQVLSWAVDEDGIVPRNVKLKDIMEALGVIQ